MSRGVVIDARGAWFVALDEQHERREHGGDRIAVAYETARSAAMHPIGEPLGNPRTARTVLGERGGPRRDAQGAAGGAGERRNRTRLAIDRSDEGSRR